MTTHAQAGPLRPSRLAAGAFVCFVVVWAASAPAQTFMTEFSLPGSTPVNTTSEFYAQSMRAGPDGGLWLTHISGDWVVRMAIDGAASTFDVTPGVGPSGLAIGPDQNTWFGIGGGRRGISRISTSGQLLIFSLDFYFNGRTVPAGLAAGPDGNVWFTAAAFAGPDYSGTGGVGKITPGGQITTYSLPYATGATGIMVSPEGNLWFVFHALGTPPSGPSAAIERINLDGTGRSVVAALDPDRAVAMALGPDGNAWITMASNSIGKVTAAGVVTKYLVPAANSSPFDITAGPDGNLWFTEFDGNKIGRITTKGVVTEFSVPTPDSGPAAICVGPDGNIWFTESKANRVGRLSLSGPASGKSTLTVPTAASAPGRNGTFFHTDLWLMNRSFTSSTPVTLVYRCFPGQSCGAGTTVLTLAPRQEVMLTDVISETFGAPNTAGAIEISWPTSVGPVSASSKISSPLPPAPEFGTMIPALPQSAAKMRALFLGLAWGGTTTAGSRSNAGAYNPNATDLDVTFTLHDGDGATLGSITRTYAPQEAYQLAPNIFDLVGAGSVITSNAYLVVTATAPVFPYVSVIENVSGDSSYVPVSDDEAQPE